MGRRLEDFPRRHDVPLSLPPKVNLASREMRACFIKKGFHMKAAANLGKKNRHLTTTLLPTNAPGGGA